MKKKLLSILTSVVCAASICGGVKPLTTDAEYYGDSLYYSNHYDYVEITACSSSAVSVEIPDEIDGLPVTSIGDRAFEDRTSLSSITIPDSVTIIGIGAFSGCSKLTNITIPDSVTSIGDRAFEDCTRLESVTIPDSVTSIGYHAFTYPAGCVDQSDPVYYVDKWVIDCVQDVTSAELKEGTRGIADYAFSDCSKLTSITIPDSVTSIGDEAFLWCTSLESIKIPDSVTSIGDKAFDDCTSLESVYISDVAAWCNIEFCSVDSNPLYYANNLYLNDELVKDLVIPDGITNIPIRAFSCSSLTSITIPDSVTSIGQDAFKGCYRIKYMEIPETVTSIGSQAFGYVADNDKIDNYVIYGTENSEAENYALRSGITFVDVNKPASLSEKTFTLAPGNTQILELNNYAGEVEWYSADEKIATVNNGYVRAVSSGTTIIYAAAGDNTFECTVNVSENPVTTAVTTTEPTVSTTVSTAVSGSDTTKNTSDTVTDQTTVSTAVSTVTTAVTTTETGVRGDADGNGKIAASDAAFIAKLIAKASLTGDKVSVEEYPDADYNGDGKISAQDAALIAKYVAEQALKK